MVSGGFPYIWRIERNAIRSKGYDAMNTVHGYTTGYRVSIIGLVQGLLRIAGRWRLRRQTTRRLSALDDRMLQDIGLERGDIAFLADELSRSSSRWPQ